MAVPYANLIDRYFAPQEDGRSIFYPRRYGRGYWIDSPGRERAIRVALERRLRIWRYVLIVEFLLVVGGSAYAPGLRPWLWAAAGAVLILGLLWLRLSNTRLIRGLMPAPERRPARDAAGPNYLERLASRSSVFMQVIQVLVLGPVAIYATRDLIAAGPTASGLIAAITLWPLVILALATLATRLRKGRGLAGPSPEALYGRSIWRPIWYVVAALFLIALIELFLQASHRPAPTWQVGRPAPAGAFDNSLRIPT